MNQSVSGSTAGLPIRRGLAGNAWFPVGVVGLALLLGTAPYLVNWVLTPPDLVFVGLLSNPLDGLSYLAKMEQGARGSWLFHLPTTSEPHVGAPVFLFYIALGHLAALADLPTVAVYHLARLGGGAALGLAAWIFFRRIFVDPAPHRFAFTLFMLGQGFGWLTAPAGYLPVDLLVPEATALHSLLANPHFPMATALLLLAMPGIDEAIVGAGNRRLIARSFALLATVLLQPFLIVSTGVVAASWWLFRALQRQSGWLPSAGRLLLLLGPAAMAAAVMAAFLYLDPVLRRWTAQNLTPSPPPWDYLLGLGWPAIAATWFLVSGFWFLVSGSLTRNQKPETRNPFLVVWLVVGAVLLYAPIGFQRRLVEGLQAPVVGLATCWLFGSALPRIATAERRRALIGGTLALALLGGLFLPLLMTLGGLRHPDLIFVRRDEMNALVWLREHTDADEVVLAAPTTSALVPVFAGNRVVYGHPFETVDAPARQAAVTAFFAGSAVAVEGVAFLERERVAYVYVGPREETLGRFDPTTPGLTLVHQSGRSAVYRVEQSGKMHVK